MTISHAFVGYIIYVYFSWFYLYLVDVRGFSLLRSAVFAASPFVAMAIGPALGGWLGDRLVPRIGKIGARRAIAVGGLVPATVLLLAGAAATNAYAAIASLSLAAGFVMFSVSAYWAMAPEIAPSHGATVLGMMNTGSNAGGMTAPILTPYIAIHYGWLVSLSVAAGFSLLAALLWKFIGGSPIESKETRSEQAAGVR